MKSSKPVIGILMKDDFLKELKVLPKSIEPLVQIILKLFNLIKLYLNVKKPILFKALIAIYKDGIQMKTFLNSLNQNTRIIHVKLLKIIISKIS